MKQKTVIETRIEELKNYDWLYYDTEDGDIDFVTGDETVAKAAKLWKVSPELVKAIKGVFDGFVEAFIDNLQEDLQDLWEEIQKVKEENY